MDLILHRLKGYIRYMDDILVYGQTEEEHNEHLSKLRQRLAENEIPENKDKGEYNKTELEFLGYVINATGVRQTDERVKAIQELKRPSSKEELHSLLGLVTYVTRFIPHLATTTEPLRGLLKEGTTFVWGQAQ